MKTIFGHPWLGTGGRSVRCCGVRVLLRTLHSTSLRCTDGVYRGITTMRVERPFIEALHKRKETSTSRSHSVPKASLEPRKMSASRHSVVLPLARDPWLLDTYISASGHIRLGTLFMDLDAMTGVVAYKHTGEDVMTVTAAVDRIQLKRSLDTICDLEVSGQVTFATGRSSMEVSMQVSKATEAGAPTKPENVFLTCAFTMVSLDPATKKPVNIPPLQIDTHEERRLFDLGQKHYEAKKALARTVALQHVIPDEHESQLIHALWQQGAALRDQPRSNTVWMASTQLRSSQIMQPQYRNRHNFMIFGGYLLKQTFELAFCCAASASHSRPTFLSLDPSTFESPVPVGSVLYLTATVAYTESVKEGGTRVQVRVTSKVRNVEHREVKHAGQFNYTFYVDADVHVMPESYSDFMMWVEARRRAEQVNASLGDEEAEPFRRKS